MIFKKIIYVLTFYIPTISPTLFCAAVAPDFLRNSPANGVPSSLNVSTAPDPLRGSHRASNASISVSAPAHAQQPNIMPNLELAPAQEPVKPLKKDYIRGLDPKLETISTSNPLGKGTVLAFIQKEVADSKAKAEYAKTLQTQARYQQKILDITMSRNSRVSRQYCCQCGTCSCAFACNECSCCGYIVQKISPAQARTFIGTSNG